MTAASLARVYLLPGAYHASPDPTLISTVLGSCIAVCLWDMRRRCGGMNHFVLPAHPRGEANARYGDVAIEQLIRALEALGCQTRDLRAKVFGGATVLAAAGDDRSIGASNLQLALFFLGNYGIPLVSQRTGGSRGIMVAFNTQSGDAGVRQLTTATHQSPSNFGPPAWSR